MTIEQIKATTRRSFEEVWNKGNVAVIDELTSPKAVYHNLPPPLPATLDGYKQFHKLYRTAFPDLHFKIEDIVAEGDKVAVRWTATGTHKGPLMNFQPTFKSGTVSGITLTRCDEKGKIVEGWIEFNQLTMLQQLGLMPMPA